MNIFNVSVKRSDEVPWHLLTHIIVSCGYEERCTHLARKYIVNGTQDKIALCFGGEKVFSCTSTETYFRNNGYHCIECSGDEANSISQLIDTFNSSNQGKVTLLVDYSCMTKEWYAALLRSISTKKNWTVYFAYSHALYVKPPNAMPNVHMGPIRGFNCLSFPHLPLALIIGLGYEYNRALGLREYIDPSETFVFYTHPPFHQPFKKDIFESNKILLKSVPATNTYTYAAWDLQKANRLLMDLLADLSGEYRIALAPLGPKPFALLCLLASIINENIQVWRVSSGTFALPVNRIADGNMTILKIETRG